MSAQIRALGDDAFADNVDDAPDALEVEGFWAQAEAAAAHRRHMPATKRRLYLELEVEVDDAFDGLV